MPGMLWGKILRSPHAHARIRKIDTSKAAALPGVRAVMTAADFRTRSSNTSAPSASRLLLACDAQRHGARESAL